MKLWEKKLEHCYKMKKTVAKDGHGGTTETYTPDGEMFIAFALNTDTDSVYGERPTEAVGYKTYSNVPLHYHDVIKRGTEYVKVLTDGENMHYMGMYVSYAERIL